MNLGRVLHTRLRYFLIALLFYVIGLLAGLVVGHSLRLPIHPTALPFFTTLWHNAVIGVGMVVAGVASFGVVNTVYLLFNAGLLGVTIRGVWNTSGPQPLVTGVLPHAVPEVVATLICCALGYESYRVMNALKRDLALPRKEILQVKETLVLLVVALILFALAAGIESFVSHA
ncbi:MAG: stage II sporulation protein M [Firmicutes bacterium]|nr:stage II sporulation protein M [Bacillota bacterium]